MTESKGKTCAKCGAEVASLVCGYCGSVAEPPKGADAEWRALEELSGLLRDKDSAQRARILEDGYIPSSPAVLIEAGVRCLPLIEEHGGKVSDKAASRLEAVLVRLKILPRDETTSRAIAEFEARVRAWHEQSARDTRLGFLLIGLALAVLAAVARVLWRRFFG